MKRAKTRPTPVSKRYPMSPYPSGWFRVASSADIAPGEAKQARYFGRDLVIFRGESGQASVLDAACPHLGAHLGVGGVVRGDDIVCPFHGWRFGTDGRCTHAPLAKRTPLARAGVWPVCEVNDQIMLWHHPDGLEPSWEMPRLPEHSDSNWLRFKQAQHWVFRSHVQELAENAMDTAHFSWLHPQIIKVMQSRTIETDGATLRHMAQQDYSVFGPLKHLRGKVAGPLEATCYGVGVVVNRAKVQTSTDFAYTYPFFITPIDDEFIEVTTFLSVRKMPIPGAAQLLRWKAAREGRITIEQDIPIWENRYFLEKPRMSDADGPVSKFRAWSKQFYESAA